MTDLRESVARAICAGWNEDADEGIDHNGVEHPAWTFNLSAADAALRAIADAGPTDAMVEAGARAIHPGWFSAVWDQIPKDGSTWDEVNREREQLRHDARACFTAMLSAALKEMGAG